MKTSKLIGPALDWAVAKCEGLNVEGIAERKADHIATWLAIRIPPVRNVIEYCDEFYRSKYIGPDGVNLLAIPCYSTDWSQGGPIIEREEIAICSGYQWEASKQIDVRGDVETALEYGSTPLIAAMRCYVASKLGNTVEIPEELK